MTTSAPVEVTVSAHAHPGPGTAAKWTGWVLSGLVALMTGVMPIVMLIAKRETMESGFKESGYPASAMLPLVIIEIVATALYLFPRTAGFGAILLTGYLGGAVATHVWAGDGGWPTAVIVGVVLWVGLVLRQPRLRAVVPFWK